MVVHCEHSLSAAVDRRLVTALCIEQLHLPTMVMATITINTDLKEANIQGLWEA